MKLSINEIAKCLDLPVSTIDRWIRQGRIPVQKLSNECFFDKSALEKWAESHQLTFSVQSDPEDAPEEEAFGLLQSMKKGGVFHNIEGSDVSTLLTSAVACLDMLSEEVRKELFNRLIEREELTSTGIGKGIAIPHPRTPMTEEIRHPSVTTFFLDKPVPYNSIDHQPVFVLFLLLSPTPQMHLHLLSHLSFCVRDEHFVSFLKTSPTQEMLWAEIEKFEIQLEQKGL